MANIYPTQQRTVDPYAEFNSNATNRLTRVSTIGFNCILIPTYLDITIDTTNQVTISTGKCVIDDVLVDIQEDYVVNFLDGDYYFSNSPFNEAGIYYLTIFYEYVKAKPAPRASIKIFKHSERANWTENYLFLKAIKVEFDGVGMMITDAYDSDPYNYDRRRRYLPRYIDIVTGLPTWGDDDKGRTIYDQSTNIFYIGTDTGWQPISPLYDIKDTNDCDVGSLGYLNASGSKISKAIANDTSKFAQCVVLEKGDSTNGKVILYGVVDNVLVESGITVAFGDRLYLSYTEAGKVTNVAYGISRFVQTIGFAVEAGTGSVKIWFCPDVNWKTTYDALAAFSELYKIKTNSSDTVPDYLAAKLTAGTNINFETVDSGGNKLLKINSIFSDNYVRLNEYDWKSDYLGNKIAFSDDFTVTYENDPAKGWYMYIELAEPDPPPPPVFTYQDLYYDTPGTYTWVKPAGCSVIVVECWGGGGGGGGTGAQLLWSGCWGNEYSYVPGSGGGGGGYSRRTIYTNTLPESVTVTVGAGGASGWFTWYVGVCVASYDGGAGGTSSFGEYVGATGGNGGYTCVIWPNCHDGAGNGAAGSGYSGDLNANGEAGGSSSGGAGAYGGAGGAGASDCTCTGHPGSFPGGGGGICWYWAGTIGPYYAGLGAGGRVRIQEYP